jgi:hypothetical protein
MRQMTGWLGGNHPLGRKTGISEKWPPRAQAESICTRCRLTVRVTTRATKRRSSGIPSLREVDIGAVADDTVAREVIAMRPVPDGVLSFPQRRHLLSKSTLPHCRVCITPNRAAVSIARVTNGRSERERDFPQACSNADSSSGVMARPMSSLVVSILMSVADAPTDRSASI